MRLIVLALTTVCSLLVSTSAIAQTPFKKGTRMIGASVTNIFFNGASSDYSYAGGLTGSFGSTGKTRSYGLAVNPSMGWFVSDNTAIGSQVQVNYISNRQTEEAGGTQYYKLEDKKFSLLIGGFVRHYLINSGSFRPFAHAGLAAGVGSSTKDGYTYSGTAYKLSTNAKSSGEFTANFNAAFGMSKMLSSQVALDFSLGYTFTYFKTDFEETTLRDNNIDGTIDERGQRNYTQKYNGHGAAITLGLQFFLEKQK